MQTTLSSGVMPVSLGGNNAYYNDKGTNRGILSDWFNADNIAAEDWLRSEQSADLAFQRNMAAFERESEFNAAEAQKARDFEERMSNTAYQRAIEDMKKAGINPVMAFSNGGASVPAGASASASASSGSPASSGSRGSLADTSQVLGSLFQIISGVIGLIPPKKFKIGIGKK